MRDLMHSMRHMKKIEDILNDCGLPGQRFADQSQFISAMLMPSEEPLSGCIGNQYSPPPEHNFPMLILATNVRIVSFISNTDVDVDLPKPSMAHPYNLIDEIHFYDSAHTDGEFRIRNKGNRRVVIYKDIMSPFSPMMAQVRRLNDGLNVRETQTPIEEVFSRKERFLNRAFYWRRTLGRLVATPTLTILLNILLAAAVIAQAVALSLSSQSS